MAILCRRCCAGARLLSRGNQSFNAALAANSQLMRPQYPLIALQRNFIPQLNVRSRTHSFAAPSDRSDHDRARDNSPAFKAHIDWRAVKEDIENVRRNVVNRNSQADPDRVVTLYDEWREAQDDAETLRSQRNANAKAMKGKLESDRRQELVEQGKQVKERLADLETRLSELEADLQREGQKLPNLSHPEAPVGGEECARRLREYGAPPDFGFEPRDHVSLGAELDLLDFESGAAAAGAKFVYLRRAAALLEVALSAWALQRAAAAGFLPMTTPDLVRASVLEKCGFQPRAENTQVYSISNSGLCLTGTAEVPLGAVHMDDILPEARLPIRMAAFGHCFRTEAGAAGSASRGLYRVHQFSKVELFVICAPEQSAAEFEALCRLEEEMYDELGLHFRVLDMPTGDLGAPAYRKVDVEAWMPGLQRYGEISSASNCTDYQSRRLNIRYRPEASPDDAAAGNGKKPKKVPTEFVHTLNATACAVPRLIVAILETHQQRDGSVAVPEVLRPFMGGLAVIEKP